MPGQPSLPLPQPLVDERPWCDDHGTPRAANDKLIDYSPLTGGVKVVRPRFAAGAPPGPLRNHRRAGLSVVVSWAVPAQRKRSLPHPLDTAPLIQTCSLDCARLSPPQSG